MYKVQKTSDRSVDTGLMLQQGAVLIPPTCLGGPAESGQSYFGSEQKGVIKPT